MPDRYGVPVVTNSRDYYFAREAAGVPNARHSLRLLCLSRATVWAKPGRIMPRECTHASLRGAQATKQSRLSPQRYSGLLRSARN